MKKLLITASTFPRWRDDTEPRFILDYAKAMCKYYDVTVLVPAALGAKSKEELEGVRVVRYHYFPIHKWETLCYPGAIVPRIRQKKIRILLVPFLFISLFFNSLKYSRQADFIHAHWLIPQGIVQSFIKKPYIVTGHGGDVTSLNKGILLSLKKRCLKNAAAVTAVSDALKNVLENMDATHEPQIISMGCDLSKFDASKRKPDFFGQGNRKVVLFVGRLAEKKGVSYLIEAMKNVQDAVLVIVGTGDLEADLKRQAKALGDKVLFLGAKTHDELPEIYASANVFVAPSITAKDGDKEGFGLVILEAMASGIPVVASASGGITDIIRHGENGLLAEEKDIKGLAEQIGRILGEDDLSRKLVTEGFTTARQYDYEVIAEKYRKLMEHKD